MNATETVIPFTENEAVKNIIMLLQGKGAEQEKQDIESLVKHIASMETQFSKVFGELQDVKAQLQTIQDKSVRATVGRVVNAAETKITEAKNQFTVLKDTVVTSFADAAEAVKQKGVSALRKTVDFFKIHSVLSHLKGKLNHAAVSLNQGISRIESMKNEIHEAKIHAQNVGRVMIGKEVKDAAIIKNGNGEVTVFKTDRGILAGMQKLFAKTGNMLSGIGKITDSALRKVEKLEQRDEKPSVRGSLKEIKRSRSDTHSSTEKVTPDKTR